MMLLLHKLSTLTLFDVLELWANIVAVGSLLSALLPPVEWFDGKPKFQQHYKMFIRVLTYYIALNLRGKIAARYNNGNGLGDGLSSTPPPSPKSDSTPPAST